jgi:hypothetical protein
LAQEKQTEQQTPPQVEFARDEDFTALYANSVIAESSVWDLKVIFGILDQSSQPNRIVQHTSINLPWTQIKLLSYLIRANLVIHEIQNGKVCIPAAIMPADPQNLELPGVSSEVRETLNKLYAEFLSTL